MKHKPMSEAEAREAATPLPLPEGEYDFEVQAADERNSKSSGQGMFELRLGVFVDDKVRAVRDYVMTEGKAAWRLRQCCESLGLLMQYERGELFASDFEGAGGRCVLTIQRDPTGTYPPQNRVKTYLPAKGARPVPRPAQKPARQSAAVDLDDEIPF